MRNCTPDSFSLYPRPLSTGLEEEVSRGIPKCLRTSAPDVVGEEFVSAGADGVEVGTPSGHGSVQGGVLYHERLEVPCRFVVIDHVSEPRQQLNPHQRNQDLLQSRVSRAEPGSKHSNLDHVCGVDSHLQLVLGEFGHVTDREGDGSRRRTVWTER